jgi:hypothetical protein
MKAEAMGLRSALAVAGNLPKGCDPASLQVKDGLSGLFAETRLGYEMSPDEAGERLGLSAPRQTELGSGDWYRMPD